MAINLPTITEIHHLQREGLNVSQIARRLGVTRKTVRKYLRKPLRAVINPPNRRSKLDPYKPFIKFRLKTLPQLSAVRLLREICKEDRVRGEAAGLLPSQPYDGSLRTLQRYTALVRPREHRTFRPVETLPGEQAQVDWGHCGFIVIDGVRHRLYVFSFILAYSRIRFVVFTTSQDMVTFLSCHQQALHYIGGVPRQILYDNAKTVVIDRVGSVIQFNDDLLRFALRYGFHPAACWMNDPESKGKTEKTIDYVKTDFLYGREVTDLATLNAEALRWCDEVANEKQHTITLEVPADRLAEERKALKTLPQQPVPIFMQVERRIRKDGTFSFETNHYSVPAGHAGQHVLLEVYRDRVDIFYDGEKIASHSRCHERGWLLLADEHMADRETGRRKRRSRLQAQFEALGPCAPDFLKGLARDRKGHLRDQVKQILALADEHGCEAVHRAMERAAHFGRFSYGAVKRIVEQLARHPHALPTDPRMERPELPYRGPKIEVQTHDLAIYGALTEVGGGD